MITLMVNVYAENPAQAVASAIEHLPVDRIVTLGGRYEGFPELEGPHSDGQVWPSEHDKRNAMLKIAGEPDPDRWLFWLDCDERVYRASPQIELQLRRYAEAHDNPVVGVRFVEPLPPDPSLLPGLEDPRRSARDVVRDRFGLRLYRHVEGLEYRGRHDSLWWNDTCIGGELMGEAIGPAFSVDVEVMHLWWLQPPERRAAKQSYYWGPIRSAESRLG